MSANFAFEPDAWLAWLFDLLSPPSCAACAGPRAGKPPFCLTCGEPALAEPGTLGGVPLIALGAYQPPLEPAIHRLKFEGHSELAPLLADLLCPRLRTLDWRRACFVPVPLHRTRLVERGYNQSALVARHLARRLGMRVAPRALERTRATEQQARLGRAARAANVCAAFRARPGHMPQRAVLIDDVVTTGATALACLEALRLAGSEVLAVVALARAERAG